MGPPGSPCPPGPSIWAVDLDVLAAVDASHLRELPPEVLDELFTGAVRAKIPAGSVAHRESEDAPYLELVIAGVIRVFVAAPMAGR